jgi:TolA-binding protein
MTKFQTIAVAGVLAFVLSGMHAATVTPPAHDVDLQQEIAGLQGTVATLQANDQKLQKTADDEQQQIDQLHDRVARLEAIEATH